MPTSKIVTEVSKYFAGSKLGEILPGYTYNFSKVPPHILYNILSLPL